MAEEDSLDGSFAFTSASTRYVMPSLSRLEMNHLLGMVSGQLCLLNDERAPNDAFCETTGIYISEVSALYRKMQQLCRYMGKFDIPEIQLCVPGENRAAPDRDVKIDKFRDPAAD